MSQKITVFVDSDVVISSIISKTGAANLLLTAKRVQKIISNLSKKEIMGVAKRMDFKKAETANCIEKCKIIELNESLATIKKKYGNFVHDINDAHIVAGAVGSKARFLITYNVKDYKIEELKRSFNLIVLTPALFLQYLRSQA